MSTSPSEIGSGPGTHSRRLGDRGGGTGGEMDDEGMAQRKHSSSGHQHHQHAGMPGVRGMVRLSGAGRSGSGARRFIEDTGDSLGGGGGTKLQLASMNSMKSNRRKTAMMGTGGMGGAGAKAGRYSPDEYKQVRAAPSVGMCHLVVQRSSIYACLTFAFAIHFSGCWRERSNGWRCRTAWRH
jgi:hypothetical protein